MAVDRAGTSPEWDVGYVEQQPPAERRPPPDRPDDDAFPSRADSRLAAAAASSGEKHGRPIDESVRNGAGPESDIPEFTPEQLAELRKAESDIRGLTEKHGVRVDYTSHPIDPANALELNKAITRMAREYPSVFRHVGIIKVLDSHRMSENGSGPNALGHAIHEGQRPTGGGEIEPGIYFGQSHFTDKSTTDLEAANDRARNWNISGTAEGTLYHEFGHVIENRLRKNSAIKRELTGELRSAGISVDPDSLVVAFPPGPQAVIDGLSRYAATKNTMEMIAEGFSEWQLDPHPRPIARAIGTVVDRHFKDEIGC
ncbi:hypothetical protein [Actinoallomurus sp. CA-142502]|uniref:hypothetical protein n=1 Tax=Actinoallomurus sp. CA-142502 TaxID=3239885 RepID=UPI003D8E5C43